MIRASARGSTPGAKAWANPRFTETRAAAEPGAIGIEEITFVSWNVHVGNGDIRAFVKDLTNGTHTDGRAVRHYVLLLQEAVRTEGVPPFGGARRAPRAFAQRACAPIDIVQISRELGLSLIYVPSMRNGASADGPAEDRGNAILSTLRSPNRLPSSCPENGSGVSSSTQRPGRYRWRSFTSMPSGD